MTQIRFALPVTSVLFCGAIFGFFYAWVCSTMWGLDQADPRVAIAAMQAMNTSVRNAVFAPAFFGTPVVLFLTSAVLLLQQARAAAVWFALAGMVYLIGGLVLTMVVNVPMNEALGNMPVPDDITNAQEVWQAYSAPWQVWNLVRTVASAVALVLAVIGVIRLAAQ